jgi:hypothetical protein
MPPSPVGVSLITLPQSFDATTYRKGEEIEREGERDASACMRRHQAFALAPVPLV